jgi:transcriptional regulator with XRE-family HTH domain
MVTLKQWRKKHGLSLRAAAERFEVTHSCIVQYESGANSPTLRTVDRIERLTRGEVARMDWPRSKS